MSGFTRKDYERLMVIARTMHHTVCAQLIINQDHRNLEAAAKELMNMCEQVLGQQLGPRWWDPVRRRHK